MEFDSDIPLDYDSDDLQTLGASDADLSGASQSDGNEGGSAGAERCVHSELSTLKDLDELKVLTELQVLNKVDKLLAVPLLFTQVNLADNVALEVVLQELAVMAPVARPRLQSGDQVPFLLLLRLRGALTLTRSA